MTQPRSPLRLSAIFKARCPKCDVGKVTKGFFSIHRRCQSCGYDFHPENGFYLGAMAVSYLLTAMLTVPPMIFLKVMKVDLAVLIAFPFIEFAFVGTFLMYYSRILWLHLEYRMTNRLG